ncbi:enoyl-CoA hydratase/isomerase family protein [Oceanospirillum maris]|uniref:enoyl-CoA hydratase/isomerase family protein n=1 Tax=Oceanospirillum maris TaxID=64977 RepID=UPI0003FABE7F|nr:enoyl-CoA hydratase/isomerase family protein [Oceanospirillum maris]
MTDQQVLCEISDQGVASVILNRPEVHNAFDDKLIAEILTILDSLNANDAVRVVILRSNGKSFSAGADLGWMKRMAQYSLEDNFNDAGELARLMHTLNNLNKPTIAMVQGAAYGGAVGLAACCDICIASEKARFCLSEVKIGLSPAVISPFVVAAIGERAARRYFLTAEVFDGAEAVQLGLAHQMVSHDELENAVSEMTQKLLANSPQSVRRSKELIARVAKGPIDQEMIEYTQRLIAEIRVSEEGQEGLSAFFEKRAPGWRRD